MDEWVVVVVGKEIIVERYAGEGAYSAAKHRADAYKDNPEHKNDTIYYYPEDYEPGIGTPMF